MDYARSFGHERKETKRKRLENLSKGSVRARMFCSHHKLYLPRPLYYTQEIGALRNHPQHHRVQLFGLGALFNFVNETANARHLVHTLQGADLVIAAMHRFADDARLQYYLQYYGSRTLFYLLTASNDAAVLPVLEQAGARRVLFEAVEAHQDEQDDCVREVQKWARRALKKMLAARVVRSILAGTRTEIVSSAERRALISFLCIAFAFRYLIGLRFILLYLLKQVSSTLRCLLALLQSCSSMVDCTSDF